MLCVHFVYTSGCFVCMKYVCMLDIVCFVHFVLCVSFCVHGGFGVVKAKSASRRVLLLFLLEELVQYPKCYKY